MILTAILSFVMNSVVVEHRFESDYTEIATSMVAEYDIEIPQIQIASLDDVRHALAATICYMREDGPECEIVFRPCTLHMSDYYRRNIIAHEVAHYINARVYGNFDHGARWRHILRRNGFRAHESYAENDTMECSIVEPRYIAAIR